MKKLLSLVLVAVLVLAMCPALAEEKPVIRALWTKGANSMPIAEMKVVTDVEEIAGIDFEVIEVPEEGAGEKINLMINTGDLPDVFMEGISKETIITYMGQDVFVPITDYITPEIMPNLHRIITV